MRINRKATKEKGVYQVTSKTRKYNGNPKLSPDVSLKIWKFVENIGASPMSAWYEVAGVHGGGSPIMETIALNLDYDFDEKKRLGRYLAGIDAEFDDSKALKLEPTFGCSLMENEGQNGNKKAC